MSDFATTFTVDRPAAQVFAAVLDARGWWNTTIDGSTMSVGDEFGFEVPGLARTRIRVTSLTPDKRVEWLVTDNAFGFVHDQTEWIGNRIVFEIEPAGEQVKLRFTQHGLVPEYECYDVCSNAWAFFIRESLRSLIETGKGQPESAAGEAPPADLARAAVEAHQQTLDPSTS